MSDGPVPVSVVILTHNEERNLRACLESVAGWAAAVYVVDSGSTDATLMVARQFDAVVAAHAFDTHARQWAWALAQLPLATEWVLALDADQRLTPELRASIASALAAPGAANGYFVCRRQVFRGRWIRHGGYYPKYLLKLFRRQHLSIDHADLVDHHFHVAAPTGRLRGDLIEDNRNEAQIADWTAKHNRYAVLQARQELVAASGPAIGIGALFGSPDDRTRWLKRVWAGLPLYLRPVLYVAYRYVLRFGWLDGKEGFIFHVLQGFWYRLLVDINIDEQRTAAGPATATTVDRAALPVSAVPESDGRKV
ncbi:MAG TPA: glycosyltransferase family 2 protein [Vicinamibacterales bacterium]|nr:glycosyltransferase family 2 protein [Vicinamibacterales bacterium]